MLDIDSPDACSYQAGPGTHLSAAIQREGLAWCCHREDAQGARFIGRGGGLLFSVCTWGGGVFIVDLAGSSIVQSDLSTKST